MALTPLQQSIIETIGYFDTFEYPLTVIEIYKWLYRYDGPPVAITPLLAALHSAPLSQLISCQHGFYFLTGKQQHVLTRLRRYRITKPKFQLGRLAAKWLRFTEFIQLIAICNNVGYNNCRVDSDIDFFIITKYGRLWWTRLWVTTLLTFLGLRRHGTHSVNRVCLSFYLADKDVVLSDVALKPDDPYLVYWLATLAPIYDRGGVYARFIAANGWLKKYLPNFYPTALSQSRRIKDVRFFSPVRNFFEYILGGIAGNWLEQSAKRIQVKKVMRYFGPLHQDGTDVVVSDKMLKFHKTDRRIEYRQRWQEKIVKLEI